MKKRLVVASLLAFASGQGASAIAANPAPVVVELFTSQGCSSCPPAEELLVELSRDPSLVPLTLHVDYWDYLGWKDPYAKAAHTERQRNYSSYLGRNNVFTPQVMVDGAYSAVGSNKGEVRRAIEQARARIHARLTLAESATPNQLTLTVEPDKVQSDAPAAVLAFRFTRATSTPVKAGENRGETLKTVNSVTSITRLGEWTQKTASFTVPAPASNSEGLAVLLQNEKTGQILASVIR
jgi:hypothetical protein